MVLPQQCRRALATSSPLLAALFLLSQLTGAAVLPANTGLEISLSVATGSRISHPGDQVTAIVIAPVFLDHQLLIPQGTRVLGIVAQVDRLGFGLKYATSQLRYRFDSLQLPDGTLVPIQADVMQVETSKERVSDTGLVSGIYPTANLSSSLASYVIPLLLVEPHFGLPFLGVKVVIARSPDPEIYFPPGTEFILRTTADAAFPDPATAAHDVRRLSGKDMAEVHRILGKLPQQRTSSGRNHPSDLINILFLGNRDAISRAFYAAGWSGAQHGSLLSIYRMYHCMVERTGYSTAPMGKLTLNGLRADAEYQKSLNTFSKRHHTRLWKQGEDEAWLSAATEDVNYHLRNMHLTHATDPIIDNERNKVINDVAFTGCVDSAAFVPRAMADQQETSIKTDGNIAVLRLNDCAQPRMEQDITPLPSSRQGSRAMQALAALRTDLIRTNPVFLVYNTIKLLCRRGTASGQKIGPPQASVPGEWLRPSVLDSQPHIN